MISAIPLPIIPIFIITTSGMPGTGLLLLNTSRATRANSRNHKQIPRGPAISYLPPPGGLILFSGAQLHETVPNTTDLARYSIDFRTVHLDDVIAHRGAPNVDSRCTGTTMPAITFVALSLQHISEEFCENV